jgi:ATP-dependent helicase/nuclease subunit A
MRRGRVDVLIPLADGSLVLDYKTDRVAAADVPARAEGYARQAAGYRRAVEAITGRPVSQVLFVFLHARVVHTV